MANRNCKEEDTCGYFKQDNKIASICAQERPIEYGKEHTGDNESYSGNNLLRKKDISGLQSEFRGEEVPIDIRTTKIKNKNSLSYEGLENHEASHSSIEIQDKVTQQPGRFSSLMKLQEDDEANGLDLKPFELESDNRPLQSGCKARSMQSNTDTKKSHRYALMCKNKNQLV